MYLTMTSMQVAAVQAGMPPRKLSADEERLAPHVPESHVPCPDIRAIWFPVVFRVSVAPAPFAQTLQ